MLDVKQEYDGMVHVLDDHSMVQHKLAHLRNKDTSSRTERNLVGELSFMLTYEATRDLPLEEEQVVTGLGVVTTVRTISGKKLCFAPIMRAGLGMLDSALAIIPLAKVAHVGLYRDEETKKPVDYFFKAPDDMDQREVFILDPMLATGGSATAAVDFIKKRGCKKVHFMGLIAAPEGIKVLREAHPDVDIWVCAVDERLDENAYIVPGLGDAGDRIYGTK